LTDKTGTLTSNTMEFKYVYINGQDYSAESLMANKQRNVQNQEFVKFWTGVVLCHDVVVDYRKN
jgi:magnesium-transporting ATPase (P-type)